MKRIIVGVSLFLLFVIFLLNPWGMVLSDYVFLLVTLAFPIGSVVRMAMYRKIVLAIPILFYIIAFFFSYSFQSWAWNAKTLFMYWVGAILGCVFAIGSIISLVLYWKRIFSAFDKQTASLIQIIGIVYNLGVILWIAFVVYAGHGGM